MTGPAKVSKAEVNYREATGLAVVARRRCGSCSMFRGPASCTLVAGRIRPGDVCDKWASAFVHGRQ